MVEAKDLPNKVRVVESSVKTGMRTGFQWLVDKMFPQAPLLDFYDRCLADLRDVQEHFPERYTTLGGNIIAAYERKQVYDRVRAIAKSGKVLERYPTPRRVTADAVTRGMHFERKLKDEPVIPLELEIPFEQ